ncbi:MAG: hypothetical protein WBO97_02185 [Tepidiformaceae bacterium]
MKAAVVLIAFVTVFCGACGSSATVNPETPTVLRPLLETPTASVSNRKPLGDAGNAEFGSFTIPPGDLDAVKLQATKEEAPVVADGVITFAEYEQLVFAQLACLEEGGLAVSHGVGWLITESFAPGPFLTKRGEYIFNASGRPGAAYADGKAVVNRCSGTFPQVEFYWQTLKTEPTEVERQQYRDAIAACLRAAGHDAPAHPAEAELKLIAFPPGGIGSVQSEPDWFFACHNEKANEFQILDNW